MRKVQRTFHSNLKDLCFEPHAILKVPAALFSADFMFHLTTPWGKRLLSRLVFPSFQCFPHHGLGHNCAVPRQEPGRERSLPCTSCFRECTPAETFPWGKGKGPTYILQLPLLDPTLGTWGPRIPCSSGLELTEKAFGFLRADHEARVCLTLPLQPSLAPEEAKDSCWKRGEESLDMSGHVPRCMHKAPCYAGQSWRWEAKGARLETGVSLYPTF